MDDSLDEKMIDFVLSKFDKLTAIRTLLALRRAQRLYKMYAKIKSEWNENLTLCLKKLVKVLEESNDEKLRREISKIKQLIHFCENMRNL